MTPIEATRLLDKHQAGANINPQGWRQPRTSKKRRLARPQEPTRIEALAKIAYGDGVPDAFEGSDRGNKKREARATANAFVSESRPLKHMHSAARRRAEAVS